MTTPSKIVLECLENAPFGMPAPGLFEATGKSIGAMHMILKRLKSVGLVVHIGGAGCHFGRYAVPRHQGATAAAIIEMKATMLDARNERFATKYAATIEAVLDDHRFGLSAVEIAQASGLHASRVRSTLPWMVAHHQITRFGGSWQSKYASLRHKDSALAEAVKSKAASAMAAKEKVKAARHLAAPKHAAVARPGVVAPAPKVRGTSISSSKWRTGTPVDDSRAIWTRDERTHAPRHAFTGEPGRHVDASQARPWTVCLGGITGKGAEI